MNYLRGSLWIKQDLHIHTASFYDYWVEEGIDYTALQNASKMVEKELKDPPSYRNKKKLHYFQTLS